MTGAMLLGALGVLLSAVGFAGVAACAARALGADQLLALLVGFGFLAIEGAIVVRAIG